MADQTTGRGKSPGSASAQFKPGQSGNRGGRPPGAQNRSALIQKVLDQFVTGEVRGRKKKIKLSEAVLLKLAQQALTGDRHSMKMIFDLWKESEVGNERERETVYPFSDIDRQIVDDVYVRMKACEEPIRS